MSSNSAKADAGSPGGCFSRAEPIGRKIDRKLTIIYWICTGLVALFMGLGSIPNILSSADSVALFQQLGYPAYLLPFLGVAKLLGVIAIIVPGFPRTKEWAYAGLTFDLAGATYSFLAIGTPQVAIIPMILGFLVIAGSYVSYHTIRKAKRLRRKNNNDKQYFIPNDASY